MTRPKRTTREELTEEQRQELLRDPWAWIDPEASAFASQAARRQAWERHGERLTREFIAERPGHRPDGWWAYSAPEGVGRHGPRAVVVVVEGETVAPETVNLAGCGELTDDERRRLPGLEVVDALLSEGGA